MPVVLTSIARVRDWKALEQLSQEVLVACARDSGATGYRVYRNVKDASQVLIVTELPDEDAVHDVARAIGEHLRALVEDGLADELVWEAVQWGGIEIRAVE